MIRVEQDSPIDQQLMGEILLAEKLINEPGSPVRKTEIHYDDYLSDQHGANIWLASELHQPIGAYKIRGAYNFVKNMDESEKERGVVTASAGNHAQGVALCCSAEGVACQVFMPKNTPANKITRVLDLGGELTSVKLIGESFDESQQAAISYAQQTGSVLAHPFNDLKVIAGQGTWGLEIADNIEDIDFVMSPVGGMGLFAGIATSLRSRSPATQMIGVEPEDAPSLDNALLHGKPTPLEKIDTFVDGAAVKEVGELPFFIARHLVTQVVSISNLELRKVITKLWERRPPLKAELAGALSVAALNHLSQDIKGKTVVCLVTGGNLSDDRYISEVQL
ncbi:MAG: pyridoxal-phosphate dependent enzyme [Candidatus Saccharimonadales bacterium]